MNRAVAAFVGVVSVAAGLYVGYDAVLAPLRSESRAEGWTETTCELDWAEVIARVDDSGTTSHHPKVRYRYQVDGRRYSGERFNFYDSPDNFDRSGFKAAYQRGRTVLCFYDPSSPGDSVIQREVRKPGRLIVGILCAVFVALGLVLIGYAWRKSACQNRKP